jgi:hypothetical protein
MTAKTFWMSELSVLPLWADYDVGIATSLRSAEGYRLSLFGRINRKQALALLRLKKSPEVEKLTINVTIDHVRARKAAAIKLAEAA